MAEKTHQNQTSHAIFFHKRTHTTQKKTILFFKQTKKRRLPMKEIEKEKQKKEENDCKQHDKGKNTQMMSCG
jgi:hypothetical protein